MVSQNMDDQWLDGSVYILTDQRWLDEDGPKIKARTERDAKKFHENQAWQIHLATLVGLWRFDTRSLPDPYEKHNKFYFGPVVRAEIYRRITGIKNYPRLVGHFRRSTYQDDLPVHVLFGFDDIPSRSMFRNAVKERFTPELASSSATGRGGSHATPSKAALSIPISKTIIWQTTATLPRSQWS